MVEIVKSQADDRTYLYSELPNRLKCLVISDPETDISAAAMCIRSGSLRDPKDIPGLSHFLEHMLFLGTEKYPNESTYDAFIEENSGTSNAYTGHEETNYYFSVAKDKLRPALDIFAQFFIAPLFTESCVEREMHAVDSENTKNLKSDEWRVEQLTCSMANPDHPFNHFATGNLCTLQVADIRSRLIEHYKANYSANLMALTLYGKEDVNTLMQWCADLLTSIPNYPHTPPPALGLPFDSFRLGNVVKVTSVMDSKEMKIMYQFPGVQHLYQSKPQNYISHLIGHKGTNSIFSMLKADGLAQNLTAGMESQGSKDYSFFMISITMTDKGMEQYETVVEIVAQYIAMLRNTGAQNWVFQEIKDLANAEFQFKSKSDPMDYTLQLASSLHMYPVAHLLTALNLIEEYKPEEISQFLDLLTPINMCIYLISKEYEAECDSAEPWYGTKYHVQSLSVPLLKKINQPSIRHPWLLLDLPPRNRFIPDTFTVLPPGPHQFPVVLSETEFLVVYHKQDNTFRKDMVMADISILCTDSAYFHTPIGHLCGEFWKKLFTEKTRELNYLASQAGLMISITNQTFGIGIIAQGFSQRFGDYLIEIFKQIAEFQVSEADRQFFHDCYEDTVRVLENSLLEQPCTQANTALSEILSANVHFTLEEQRKALSLLTLEDLIYFSNKWLKTIRSEWLLIGNISAEKATEISSSCMSQIITSRNCRFLDKEEIPPELSINIPPSSELSENLAFEAGLIDKTNQNSCCLSYWQLGPDSLPLHAQLSIIHSLLKEPTFSVLRTQKQLGYIVYSRCHIHRRVLAHYIVVQSHIASPAKLAEHISSFLSEVRPTIAALSDDAYQKHRESVYHSVTKKDVSLEEEFLRYGKEMRDMQYVFDRREQLGEALLNTRKEDVQSMFERLFFTENKRLDIEFVSENLKLEQSEATKGKALWRFRTVNSLKRALPTYPGRFEALKR